MAIHDRAREVLANRAQGQYPLSIATSLAIESLLGVLPDAPTDKPEVEEIDILMINVRTLFRNLMGAVDTELRSRLSEYAMAEAIAREFTTIESILSEKRNGRIIVQLYHCTYLDVLMKFKRGVPKLPETPGQKQYQNAETMTIDELSSNFPSAPMVKYNTSFDEVNLRGAILTHYPIDLLNRYKFTSLKLLESHTGAIKSPLLWNTKLKNGKELEMIPFDRMSLQIFGDGVTFSPAPIKIRRVLIELAKTNKWTPATTMDKVINDVVNHRDPALEVLVKESYRR